MLVSWGKSHAALGVAMGRRKPSAPHHAALAVSAPNGAKMMSSLLQASPSPAESSSSTPRAAYVHLPFCKRKCFYCDFPVQAVGMAGASSGHVERQMREYVDAVCREIAVTAAIPPSPELLPGGGPAAAAGPGGSSSSSSRQPLTSIFFGGGTPSLVPPPLVDQLLKALDARFGIATGAEISLEADPGTFDAARLAQYTDMGITRLSMGVQSFNQVWGGAPHPFFCEA